MRRSALLLVAIAMFVSLAAGPVMAEPLLDQQQTTFDGFVQIDSQGSQYYRQYFTAGISGKLDAVSLYLGCCKNGNGFSDGNLYIDIFGGGISSQYVITSGTFWWPSSPMWRTFTLDDAPVVEAGEQYYIRLHSTASRDAGHLWGVTSSDVYSGGNFEQYVAESGWSDTGQEATFKTYVTPSDGTPPETTITSGPSGIVSDPTATFTFASSEGSSTFECRTSGGGFGGGSWSTCQAPWNIGPSPNGTYTLEVKASDASGSTDPTPATRTWTVDTTPPETNIDSGPSGPTNDNTPTFTFSGSDNLSQAANLRYSYKVDGGEWSAYSSETSVTLGGASGLPEGSHTFYVKAKDEAGNEDQIPAERSFTVDTEAPKVNSTSPANGAILIAPGANVTATFSEAMDASPTATDGDPETITGATFKLMQAGTTTPIEALVNYNATTNKAILDPNAKLQLRTKYKAVVTTGTQDVAGNRLDQDQDPSNGLQKMSWTFTIRN